MQASPFQWCLGRPGAYKIPVSGEHTVQASPGFQLGGVKDGWTVGRGQWPCSFHRHLQSQGLFQRKEVGLNMGQKVGKT